MIMSKKLKMSLSDSIQKFILENHNVRGVIVHLTDSFRTMLEKHDYPPAVQKQLGEILLAAAMLAETIKLKGRMTVQFQSDGALKMLVAQINNEGQLRGLAQWDASASEAELEKGLGEGSLVLTIFQKHQDQPMQSIVPLEHRSIADALAFYFLQSEQLPTVFSFAVKDDMASGFLLQMMPEQADEARDIAWSTLVDRVKAIDVHELFYDNNASFLQYHFGDENIRIFDSRDLVFQCGCSFAKMEQAIRVIGHAEANLIIKEQSEIVVTCEYCNAQYAFDRAAVENIFRVH
jgi:molecular chaperone Hsp33